MGSKTDGNLQEAFAGESQANRKYLFFAEKADKEGHPQVARLFRAVADAETVHARNHLNVLNGVGTTEENLVTASEGEHHEFTAMYPPFIEEADKEGNTKAKRTFEYANEVEEVHHGLFQAALKAVKEGAEIKEESYYVCQVCGYTAAGEAPDKCPVCGALAKSFNRID